MPPTSILPEDVRFLRKVEQQINDRMFGLEGVVRGLLAALVTGGHALLEGNPGLGKTALVKTIGETINLPNEKVGRIQFTPDLMPADITGTLMPTRNDVTRLEFQEGPIFKWLLLADEINRATPKTQAAMLEAMAEKQVTVLGERRSLIKPERVIDRAGSAHTVHPPFMVMATQNPIDLEGTYNLPEAQSDRFMFKLRMPFPNSTTLQHIIEQELRRGAPEIAAVGPNDEEPASDPEALVSLLHLDRLNRAIRAAAPNELMSAHIRNLLLANEPDSVDTLGLPAAQTRELKAFCKDYIRYPLGPRAAFAMELGARAYAVLALLDESATGEVADHAPQALGSIAIPAIRHRVKLKRAWDREATVEEPESDLDPDRRQDRLLADFVMLCSPNESGYRDVVESSLDAFHKNPF